ELHGDVGAGDGQNAVAILDELEPLLAVEDPAPDVRLDVVVGAQAFESREILARVGLARLAGGRGDLGTPAGGRPLSPRAGEEQPGGGGGQNFLPHERASLRPDAVSARRSGRRALSRASAPVPPAAGRPGRSGRCLCSYRSPRAPSRSPRSRRPGRTSNGW